MSEGKTDKTLLDDLTNIDNILSQVRDILKEVRNELGNIEPKIVSDRLVIEEGVPRESYQLEMSMLVDPGETESETREMPFDGWVDGFIVGFPDGTDQSVGLRLEDDDTGTQYFPRNREDNYFAANDYSDNLDLAFEIEEGQKLTAELKNNDSMNEHFINVMVTVKRKDGDEVVTRGN